VKTLNKHTNTSYASVFLKDKDALSLVFRGNTCLVQVGNQLEGVITLASLPSDYP
jgi:hypothetical protein